MSDAVFGNCRQFFIMRHNDRADLEDMGKDIALPEITQHAIMNYPLPDHQTGQKCPRTSPKFERRRRNPPQRQSSNELLAQATFELLISRMPNAETKTPLAVRRDGKGKIWSHVRQSWFVEFPEEVVRQQFVCKLVNDYGFSLEQMDEEIATQHGRGSVEADVVIWRKAKDKTDEKPPLIVAECKSDNVTIDKKDYGQGESYARNVGAPFFVTHNNRETRFWRVKKDRMPGYIEEIADIPRADATDKEIDELIKKLKVFKEDEFADLLHQCHNVIRNRKHLDPAAAFDEIAKVLFMKVCFERPC